MGQFSNGTEGDTYEAHYCSKCKHEIGCPVWWIHLEYNSMHDKDHNIKAILDHFIPMNRITNLQCKMFIEKDHLEV